MSLMDAGSWTAISLGLAAAVSLPIGAAVGLLARPSARVTAALMAFGSGTLLFALSIELVAESHDKAGYFPVAIGCLAGGILFELLNHGLGRQGAFLRKAATILRHVTHLKRKRAETLLGHVAQVDLIRCLPPRELARLVPHADEVVLPAGTTIFEAGNEADAIHVVEEGSVEVRSADGEVERCERGASFGHGELMTDLPHVATAVTLTPVRLFRIPREDFQRLVELSPEVRAHLERLADEVKLAPLHDPVTWHRKAVRALADQDLAPTHLETHAVSTSRGDSSLGIWLGNVLDGVPESLILGMMVRGGTGISFALLGGVFLSNLPEAMSSSTVMKSHGYSSRKIVLMWGSIVVLSGACAFVGSHVLPGAGAPTLAMVEGVAAGAMLTMIAETMLPEAFEQGGAIVGLSTLLGFLAALSMRARG